MFRVGPMKRDGKVIQSGKGRVLRHCVVNHHVERQVRMHTSHFRGASYIQASLSYIQAVAES